ncbi:MAG: 3-phosphoglycerate dehydrogenase [Oscillospiraceae bacterium]|nr:3-phosphoglycerate dehydrogenase [Oscillospiraceae bacterium]
MFDIKTYNKISDEGLSILKDKGCNVGPDIKDPEGIILRSADLHNTPFGDNLLAIARAGAGYNNNPIDECAEKGIVVFNTPGANAEGVKELELCSLVMSSRDVLGSIAWVRSVADKGREIPALVEKAKSDFAGPELMGKTIGVLGLGATGAMVANIALEIGMNVLGYDPFMSVEAAWMLSREVKHVDDLDEVFSKSDYISINIPYNENTHHLLNDEAFSKMKQGIRIINESRAEVVDDIAMTKALDSGKVAKYVTDFPNETILKAPNVIAMPHLGACTPESEDRCAVMAANELFDYLENGNIKNSVNLPNASLERMGNCRLCVLHRNKPRMITRILDFISARNINVEHMINKPRGGYAYTIVDLGKKIGPKTAEEMRSMEDILRLRVLYVD